MSTTIDERVVEMRFDNKHFESNVKTSMSTLEKLKEKLHLTGASKGLENVSAAAKNVNMSGLGAAVEGVSAKFSALQVMGVTALANITNSAVNAGKRIAAALTIDPVKTGFSEYETKINSIQTIMSNTASKGTTMEDVTRVINELNTYADKTIYNFAEMTRNIGTFTAAGVGLEESAAAIQGIANLAAASGSTSQQASTAMYQLSQAISTGTVRLMDWNSVVNAGMGGELFQEAIKDTAREYGVAVDDIIKKSGSFRDSLQEEWLSAEILNTTLRKFTTEGAKEYADSMVKSGKYTKEQADALLKEAQAMEDAATKVKTFTQLWDTMKESAQSGWAQTWELIFGDFEEAKEFFSGLSETLGGIIEASSEARNKFLGGALNSKWDTFTEKVNKAGISTDDFKKKLTETAKEHGVAIDDLIKEHGSLEKVISSGHLSTNIIVETLKKFSGAEDSATESTEAMTAKLEKFQKVVDEVWRGDFGDGEERVKALTEAGYDYATVQDLVNKTVDGHRLTLEDLSDAQLENLGYTDEQIEAIRKLAKEAEKTGTPLNELMEDIQKPSGRELLIDSLNNALKGVIKTCGALKDAWVEVFPPMTSDQLYNIIDGLNKLSKHLAISDETADKLKRTFKGVFALLDIVLTLVGGPLRIAFKAIVEILGMADIDLLDFTASIGDAIVKFRDWIDASNIFTRAFKKILPSIKKAGAAIRDWLDGIKDADNIPKYIIQGLVKGLYAGIKAVGDAMIELGKTILEKIKNVLGIHSPSTEFIQIGKDIILGLVNGLQNGASVVWNTIKNIGLKCIEIIKNLDFGTIFAGVLSAGAIWAVIGLTNALNKLSAPLEGLGEMFEGIGEAFEGLGKYFKAKALESRSKAILNMAIAVGILALSVALLTKLDTGKLWASIGALAVLSLVLVALSVASSKLSDIQGFGFKSASIIAIAGALLVLAFAMKQMSTIKGEDVPKTIGMFVLMVAGISAILFTIGKIVTPAAAANIDKVGKMLVKMSIALLLMVGVIKLASKLDGTEVIKGVGVVAAIELLFAGIVMVSAFAQEHSGKVGGSLFKMSIAMLVMLGVIKLASMMEIRDVVRGIGVVTALGVLFAGMVYISSLAGPNVSNMGTAFLGIASALLFAALAIKVVSNLNISEILKGLAVIAALEILFAGLVYVSNFAGQHASSAGSMLLKMSVALLILSGVLLLLSLLNPDKLWQSLGVIAILEALFAGIIFVSKYAADSTKSLITITVAIGLLAVALIALSFIDQSKLTAATIAMAAVMGVFALLVKATSSLKDSKGILKTLIPMVAVIGVLAAIMWGMSALKIGSSLDNVASLSLLLLAMSAAMVVLSKAPNVSAHDVGKLALMGLVVGELGVILRLLDEMKLNASIKNVGSLSLLLNAMAVAMVIMSAAVGVTEKDVGKLALMGLVVGELGLILGVLNKYDLNSSVGNALTLSVVLNAMAAAMVILTASVGVTSSDVLKMAMMGLVVGELGVVLGLLNKYDLNSSIDTVTALSAMLLAMSGVLAVLTLIGPSANAAYSGMAALGVLIAATGGVLLALAGLNALFPDLDEFLASGLPLLETLGYALGSFVGHIIGGFSDGALSGLPAIGEHLSGFMNNAKDFIEGAKSITSEVGDGILALTGAILALTAANVISGIMSFLPFGGDFAMLGKNLSSFMTNAKGFIDGIAGVNADSLSGVDALADAILTLTEAELVSGIASLFGGGMSFEDFGTQLKPFGEGLVAYAEAVSSLTEGDIAAIDTSVRVATALANMAKEIPNTGGLLAGIVGDNNLVSFAVQLALFGKGLVSYANSVSDISEDDIKTIETSVSVATALSDLAHNIPNAGGLLSAIVGDNDLASFAFQISCFGKGLKSFVNSVSELSEEDVSVASAAISVAEALSGLAHNVPNAGGMLATIVGDNDLTSFAFQISCFGKGLKSFINSVSGMSEDNISAASSAVNVAIKLSELARSVPNVGGMLAAIVGDNDLASFAIGIGFLGKGLSSFAENVSDMKGSTLSSVEASVTVAEAIANIQGTLGKTGGIKSWWEGDNGIDTFGSNLEKFANSLVKFSKKTAELNTTKYSSIATATETLAQMARSTSQTDGEKLTAFGDKVKSFGDKLKEFDTKVSAIGTNKFTILATSLHTLADTVNSLPTMMGNTLGTLSKTLGDLGKISVVAFVTELQNGQAGVETEGKKLSNSLTKGMTSRRENVINVSASIAKSAALALDDHTSDCYNAGVACVDGFARGISENDFKAEAKARAMAAAAAQAAKDALDINSPSKIFAAIGSGVVEGFVKGIDDNQRDSLGAISSMAKTATNGFTDAISRVSDLLESDMDAEPTIRPILDLSDVRSGMGSISSILNSGYSVGAYADVGAISSMMRQRNQNGANHDIVSAIKELRNDVDKMAKPSYTINGITYDDGTNLAEAVKTIIREARIERRR